MTCPTDRIVSISRGVAFIDISYSSEILEDLHRTDNLKLWRDLLMDIKDAIIRRKYFEIYKFIGDGWVLLFDPSTPADEIINGLLFINFDFTMRFDSSVGEFLECQPKQLGLTCGLDSGPIIQLKMHQRKEYIGRSINVASRLQSTLKEIDTAPQNKILTSAHYFQTNRSLLKRFLISKESVPLRNLSDNKQVTVYKLGRPKGAALPY